MLARTAAFDAAVAQGGRVVTAIASVLGPQTLHQDLAGCLVPGSGLVTIDRTASIRRTLKASFADEDGSLLPFSSSSPLYPGGQELTVRTGFDIGGAAELKTVGVFGIVEASADGHVVTVTAEDRGELAQEAGFERPYVLAAATNKGVAAYNLLASAVPGMVGDPPGFVGFTGASTTATIVYEEGDRSGGGPLAAAQKIAQELGAEVFFGPDGRPRIRRVPDPGKDPPVLAFAPGERGLLKRRPTYAISRRGVRNVAVGAAEGAEVAVPLRFSREIRDPLNPMNPGRIGRRPIFQQAHDLQGVADLDQMTYAMLQSRAGMGERLSFVGLCHPCLEEGDVVTVAWPDMGLDVRVVLDGFSIPLDHTGREVAYAASGARSVT